MFNKIKENLYFKYGIRVESRQIWMILILLGSILLLVVSLIANYQPSGPKVNPQDMTLPGLK